MKYPSVNPHFQVTQMSGSTPIPMPSSHRFLTPLPFHASPGMKQVLLCISLFRPGILKFSSTGTLTKRPALGFGRGGFLLPVRGHTEEVERADEQAEFEAGVKNATKGWSGEQDNRKAQALVDSTIYPIMRVYRNDLCSLEVTGDAKAWQVLEAMGADGGLTALEELSKRRSLMTVETIIPGRCEDHSTVSTKLLAPTQLVKKMASSMSSQKVSHRKVSLSSGNALAKAFEKVTMDHLLSFDIHVHCPGAVRDMANLANEKEDAVVASLESREPKVLDGLAKVVCAYSMENIKENFDQKVSRESRYNKKFFWRNPGWIWALNKAIGVSSLSESEIWEHAERILDKPPTFGERMRTHQDWWPPPFSSIPSNILPDQGWNTWCTEFLPIHKLQIDTSKVSVLAKGWQTTKTEQVLELHLTHSQLVDLGDMLDLYYVDGWTAPAKSLHSGIELKESHHSRSKYQVSKVLWTAALSCLAGGVLLVGLLVVARMKTSSSTGFLSNTFGIASSRSASSFKNKWCRVQTDCPPILPKNNKIPAEEMEALCCGVVDRVKEGFDLVGQVESSPQWGAWLGIDLAQREGGQTSLEERVHSSAGGGEVELRKHGNKIDRPSTIEGVGSDGVLQTSAGEPLLLYQVVLSRNGKVLGFQPGNKLAIAHWVEYPFAQELHKGHRLVQGLFEHELKYSELLEDVVAIELLVCQSDMDAPFVAARPLKF